MPATAPSRPRTRPENTQLSCSFRKLFASRIRRINYRLLFSPAVNESSCGEDMVVKTCRALFIRVPGFLRLANSSNNSTPIPLCFEQRSTRQLLSLYTSNLNSRSFLCVREVDRPTTRKSMTTTLTSVCHSPLWIVFLNSLQVGSKGASSLVLANSSFDIRSHTVR